MAISSSTIRLLERESKRKPFKGSVLQLGRQEIWSTEKAMLSIASKEGYDLVTVKGDYPLKKSKFVDFMCMDDVQFFKMLGFSSVHSLDVNDFEGADVLYDMNVPIPSESRHLNKYDVIFDGGTLEHVFHVPQFLKNVFDLLAVNGRIIHCSPVDMFNHGFYNFSPCLFEDFYGANNFEINTCWIVKKPYNTHFNGSWYYTVANRNSQFIRSLCADTLDKATHGLFFVATKLSTSTGNIIPTQGYYEDIFCQKENYGNNGLVAGNSPLKSAYTKLRSIPVVNSLARYFRDAYARSRVKWESV